MAIGRKKHSDSERILTGADEAAMGAALRAEATPTVTTESAPKVYASAALLSPEETARLPGGKPYCRYYRVMANKTTSFRGQMISLHKGEVIDAEGYGGAPAIILLGDGGVELEPAA